MKTVTLKFVVEDEDAAYIHDEIMTALDQGGLGSFPMLEWDEKESTKKEIKWKKSNNKHE